jgi:quercetin dioxygenase-like cupin family protein
MRRAILLVVLGVSTLALVVVVGAALATPPKGATTTVLTRATFGTFAHQNSGVTVKSKRDADLVIAKQVIEPGGSSGWHHHPAVSFFLVKSGSVTAYDENCKKTVYKAGEGFIESSDAHPGLVRNQGKVDAVIYATHIIPTKTTEEGYRIGDPQPKNCNVK